MIDKEEVLDKLEMYKDNMSEFEEEEMLYLIKLVEGDMTFVAKAPTILKYSKAERYDG